LVEPLPKVKRLKKKTCWKMIKVVPDTNIIISSIFWEGNPYTIIKEGVPAVASQQVITKPVENSIIYFNK
jgi:hypothetical protein